MTSGILHALVAVSEWLATIAERMGEPAASALVLTGDDLPVVLGPQPGVLPQPKAVDIADALDEMAARQAVEPECPIEGCTATEVHWHHMDDLYRKARLR